MRHQPPEPALAQRRAQRRARRRQAGKLGHARQRLDQPQRRAAAAERQSDRQIAVEAQRVDRQHRAARGVGVELRVVRSDIHLGAGQRRRRAAVRDGRSRPRRRCRDRRASAGGTAATAGTAVRQRLAHPLDLQTSIAVGRLASGTMRYSMSVWVSRIGSQRCGNRLTNGVQPSASDRRRSCAPVPAGRGRGRRRFPAGRSRKPASWRPSA